MPEYGTPPTPPTPQPPWPPQPSLGGYPPSPYPYHAPYPGYLPPGPGSSPWNGPRNGLGIAALVAAIAGLVTALSVVLGVALGLTAVALGFAGRARAKRGEADNGAVATAGIVLGVLAVIAGIGCIFIYIGIWKTAGAGDYVDCMSKAGSDTTAQQQCTDRLREHFEDKFGGSVGPAVHESHSAGTPT